MEYMEYENWKTEKACMASSCVDGAYVNAWHESFFSSFFSIYISLHIHIYGPGRGRGSALWCDSLWCGVYSLACWYIADVNDVISICAVLIHLVSCTRNSLAWDCDSWLYGICTTVHYTAEGMGWVDPVWIS